MFKLTLEELKILWEDFGNTPINNDDEIEEDFIIDLSESLYIKWEKGASRFDIWHWFDEHCPNNLHDDLMFPKEV